MVEEKIKIIDQIVTRHPSYGVQKGWSDYTGGMKDSGDWYFRKMLDVDIDELKSFLNGIIEEENKPKIEREYTEEEKNDMNTWHQEGEVFYSEYFKKQMIKMEQDINDGFLKMMYK